MKTADDYEYFVYFKRWEIDTVFESEEFPFLQHSEQPLNCIANLCNASNSSIYYNFQLDIHGQLQRLFQGEMAMALQTAGRGSGTVQELYKHELLFMKSFGSNPTEKWLGLWSRAKVEGNGTERGRNDLEMKWQPMDGILWKSSQFGAFWI